jgi:hypothetical protein
MPYMDREISVNCQKVLDQLSRMTKHINSWVETEVQKYMEWAPKWTQSVAYRNCPLTSNAPRLARIVSDTLLPVISRNRLVQVYRNGLFLVTHRFTRTASTHATFSGFMAVVKMLDAASYLLSDIA